MQGKRTSVRRKNLRPNDVVGAKGVCKVGARRDGTLVHSGNPVVPGVVSHSHTVPMKRSGDIESVFDNNSDKIAPVDLNFGTWILFIDEDDGARDSIGGQGGIGDFPEEDAIPGGVCECGRLCMGEGWGVMGV